MRVFWITGTVVLLDQATKAAVLQLMYPQQSIPLLGDWLRLTFTENSGMAFGLTVGPPGTVTVLSIGATILVSIYIYQVRHDYAPYRWSLAFILGGALGNIVDRVFYGVVLDYGTYFTGHVVDFIHVSLWQGFVPQSIPVVGGSYLELFPIWNVADMSIVLGVTGVLLFHHTFHERRMAAQHGSIKRRPEMRTLPTTVCTDLGDGLNPPPAVPKAVSRSSTSADIDGTVRREEGAFSEASRSSAVS